MNKMYLTLSTLAAGFVMMFTHSAVFAVVNCQNPADTQEAIQCGSNSTTGIPVTNNPEGALEDVIKTIVNILTILVGIIAVIMIIVSGFRYITSGGDAQKITSAKNTLVYAIIGLIIVALAQIIVKLVINETTNPSAPGSSSQSTGSGTQNPPCIQLPNGGCAPGTGP